MNIKAYTYSEMFKESRCVCTLAHLLLGLILGPSGLAIFLAQCLLLLMIQQRVVLVIANDLIFKTVEKFSQNGVL